MPFQLPRLPGFDDLANPARQAAPAVPLLSPEEEEAAVSSIGGNALSMLSYLGRSLGKAFGGRAIRGGLGGNARELLSIIPFSDALGITKPEQEVFGSELLGDKDAPFFSGTGLGGFALDVLTDPGSYLTFGGSALSRAGQVAKKAGILPKTTAARAGQTLEQAMAEAGKTATARGLADDFASKVATAAEANKVPLNEILKETMGGTVGFGLPFMKPMAVAGSKPLLMGADSYLAQGAGKLGSLAEKLPGGSTAMNLLRRGGEALEPLGRAGRKLFQPEMMGVGTKLGQQFATDLYSGIEAGHEAANIRIAGMAQDAAKLGLLGPEGGEILRHGLEETATLPVSQAVRELTERIRSFKDELWSNAIEMGAEPAILKDEFAKHFPRYLTEIETTKKFQGPHKALQTEFAGLSGRQEYLKGIKGGTSTVNRAFMDPDVRAALNGPNPLVANDLIAERYLGYNQQRWIDVNNEISTLAKDMKKMTDPADLGSADVTMRLMTAERDALNKLRDQGAAMTNFFAKLDPKLLEAGGPFANHVLDDLGRYANLQVRRQHAMEGTYKVLNAAAVDAPAAYGEAARGFVKVQDLMGDLKITPDNPATVKKLEALGIPVAPDASGQLTAGFMGKYVPKEIAEDLKRFMGGHTTDTPQLIEAWDKMHDLFKSYAYLWPASYSRNLASALWQKSVTGANPVGSIGLARDLLNGKTVEGLSEIPMFKGMTPKEATERLSALAYGRRIVGQHAFGPESGEFLQAGKKLSENVPGITPRPLLPLGEFKGGKWGPLAPLDTKEFGYTKGARATFAAAEDTVRLSQYVELLKQGYADDAAANIVRASQVDYRALTDFERSTMRRIAPFYTFSRRMVPWQLEELATKPGGQTAMTIKGLDALRGRQEQFTPAYMERSAAIPWGEKDETGTQRFLSQLGLPFEELPQTMSARGIGGMLSPYIKAPIELMTGTQIYSGRRLADLYSPTGNILTDQLLYNSPVSRVASTIGDTPMLDPRKGWGDFAMRFLTGARLTDVDMEKAKRIAVREHIQDTLRGPAFRRFESVSVRPEDMPNLSPDELLLYRLGRTLDARRRQQQAQQARR